MRPSRNLKQRCEAVFGQTRCGRLSRSLGRASKRNQMQQRWTGMLLHAREETEDVTSFKSFKDCLGLPILIRIFFCQVQCQGFGAKTSLTILLQHSMLKNLPPYSKSECNMPSRRELHRSCEPAMHMPASEVVNEHQAECCLLERHGNIAPLEVTPERRGCRSAIHCLGRLRPCCRRPDLRCTIRQEHQTLHTNHVSHMSTCRESGSNSSNSLAVQDMCPAAILIEVQCCAAEGVHGPNSRLHQ